MEQVQEIFTDQIVVPLNNMRQHIDRAEIFELAEDIKKNGLISAILVRPLGAGYEVVAGQRRLLAHQFAGIIKIKCFVRELTDEQALAIMTSENLARVDVNPLDEANHAARLMQSNNNNIKKVADIMSRSEKWVRDRLCIVEMPDYMQELLAKKELKIGVALILVQIKHESYRRDWTLQAVRDGANIKMAEYWLADYQRRLLPGGELAGGDTGQISTAPPEVVLFECAIDGKKYDTRMSRALFIYEGNLQYFSAFAEAFRSPPSETELPSGGD